MGRNHLKRIAMPKAWELPRKATAYIARPAPGAHALHEAMPLGVLLRETIGIAKTAREVRYILQQREVFVDGKRRKADDLPVGPMDVVALPQIAKYFRIMITASGKLGAVPIPAAEQHRKICRITGKRMRDGKVAQMTLSDGRSISGDAKQYRVGDSVLLELPAQKVAEHFPMAEGATVYMTGGLHCGAVGTITRIAGNVIHIRSGELQFQTPKRYVFVIGRDKPAVTVEAQR